MPSNANSSVESFEGMTTEDLTKFIKKYGVTKDLAAMRQKMLDDVFVFSGIAALGESTVIYAAPNTGKTLLSLFLLREATALGNIPNPELVIYVNADDSFKGLTKKGQIIDDTGAEEWIPGHNGITLKSVEKYLRGTAEAGIAKNCIVILDTLKKFTDTMSKTRSSDFGKVIREFTLKGGTVISLAHTNKHKGEDGRSVPAGTSDILDDCDCAYVLETIDDSPVKVIELVNRKSRGDVEASVSFSYDSTLRKDYGAFLDSVKRLTKAELKEIKAKAKAVKEAYVFNKTYGELIEVLQEILTTDPLTTKEILILCREEGFSNSEKIHRVLKKLAGSHWKRETGIKNTKSYSLIGIVIPNPIHRVRSTTLKHTTVTITEG